MAAEAFHKGVIIWHLLKGESCADGFEICLEILKGNS